MAHARGVSRDELIEFLEVAMTMQGCPGEEWALKAYSTYEELLGGQTQDFTDSCCTTHLTPAAQGLGSKQV